MSGILIISGAKAPDWSGFNGSNNTGFTTFGGLPTGTAPLALVTVSPDEYALGYTDNTAMPKAAKISRAGDVLTLGTQRTISTAGIGNTQRYQLQSLDTNKLAAFYAGNGGDIDNQTARLLTGTGLTLGSEINLGTVDRDQNLDMVQLDTDKILYIRSRGIASFNMWAQIRTNTSPTVFASGNFTTLASGTRGFYVHSAKLSTTHVVVAFQNQSTQALQLRVVENTTGNTTVTGSVVTISDVSGVTDGIVHLLPIDETHVALMYSGSSSGGKTYIRLYSISGTTLTEELGQTEILSEQLLNNNSSQSVLGSSDYVKVSDGQFLIVANPSGTNTTKAYIVRFPTPTTFDVPATVTLSGTVPYSNIVLQPVDPGVLGTSIVLMVGWNNTGPDDIDGMLIKL